MKRGKGFIVFGLKIMIFRHNMSSYQPGNALSLGIYALHLSSGTNQVSSLDASEHGASSLSANCEEKPNFFIMF